VGSVQRDLVERAQQGDHDAFAALAGAAINRLDTPPDSFFAIPNERNTRSRRLSSAPGGTSLACVIPIDLTPGCIGSS
jgi:hypothetical protein